MFIFWKLTLKGGWRTRSSRAVFALAIFAILAAWIAGTFSPRQPQTVAFDVGFSLIRILAALVVLFWVQELVGKDLERRTALWVCANPVSRSAYAIGRFAGIATLAFLALVMMGGLLATSLGWVAPQIHQAKPLSFGWPLLLAFLFLWLDLLVICAFALLIALAATTTSLPFFVGLAFVLVARALGPTLAYATSSDTDAAAWAPALEAMQWFVPDLSRYDVRQLVLYGQWPPAEQLYFVPLQALAYVTLLLVFSGWVFARREFE